MTRHSRKRDQHGSGPGGEKGHGTCGEFHLLGCTPDVRGRVLAVLGGEPQGDGCVRPPARVSVCLAKGLRLNSNGAFSLRGLTY